MGIIKENKSEINLKLTSVRNSGEMKKILGEVKKP